MESQNQFEAALEKYNPTEHLHRNYYNIGNLRSTTLTYYSTPLHLLENNNEKEAKKCYLQAIEISQIQSDLWHELLATKSLSKLWKTQGKSKEAFEMLSEVYGKFTEGFETIDMMETKNLLEELKLEMA